MLDTKLLKMRFDRAKKKLDLLGQSQILNFWETLSSQQKDSLLGDIEKIDINFLLHALKAFDRSKSSQKLLPYTDYEFEDSLHFTGEGLALLKGGKVGAIIAAGGEGSRLGFHGPKGCFPISNVKQKSLFQLFAEKTVYASRLAGHSLPLAIMTSTANHEQTVRHFEEHRFFGLDHSQVSFFKQSDRPLLNTEKKIFLENPYTIAQGPDGNGAFFQDFVFSGIWKDWKEKGIKNINYVPIDNPLADLYDQHLLEYHKMYGSEVTIKCISRFDPNEKVGVIVREGSEIRVVEYSEIDQQEKNARDAKGKLKHRCANISLFCMDMNFIQAMACDQTKYLPYHVAVKQGHYKFEKFIFDMLPFAKKVGTLMYARGQCFAPLKNPQGKDSPDTVKQALLERDKMEWMKVAKTSPRTEIFELSQEFYYANKEFLLKWEHKKMPSQNYIEGEFI